jgi:hypothetical protein
MYSDVFDWTSPLDTFSPPTVRLVVCACGSGLISVPGSPFLLRALAEYLVLRLLLLR